MLNDFTGADKVYIACGYTDLRKGIDGLARMVQQQFELDPFTNTLFLFCGRRRDRIKGLYWECCVSLQVLNCRHPLPDTDVKKAPRRGKPWGFFIPSSMCRVMGRAVYLQCPRFLL